MQAVEAVCPELIYFVENVGRAWRSPVPEKKSDAYDLSKGDFKDQILKNMRALMPQSLATKISRDSSEVSGIRREASVLLVELTNEPVDKTRGRQRNPISVS